MQIALIRLSLRGMLVKKYSVLTLNRGVKFHVTKLLNKQFLPLVASLEAVRGFKVNPRFPSKSVQRNSTREFQKG
jgi:hypothetical protein